MPHSAHDPEILGPNREGGREGSPNVRNMAAQRRQLREGIVTPETKEAVMRFVVNERANAAPETERNLQASAVAFNRTHPEVNREAPDFYHAV